MRATAADAAKGNVAGLPEVLLFGVGACPERDARGNGLLWKHFPCGLTYSFPQMSADSPALGLLMLHSA